MNSQPILGQGLHPSTTLQTDLLRIDGRAEARIGVVFGIEDSLLLVGTNLKLGLFMVTVRADDGDILSGYDVLVDADRVDISKSAGKI